MSNTQRGHGTATPGRMARLRAAHLRRRGLADLRGRAAGAGPGERDDLGAMLNRY